MSDFSATSLVTLVGGVVIALVILLVVLGGRMPKAVRSAVEVVAGALLFPTLTAFWTWRAIYGVRNGDWIYAGLMAVAAGAMAITGIYAVRRRTLTPFARRSK